MLALTTLASASGLPTDSFLFLGFVPHKKGRETLFKRVAESKETVIIYESPHRFLKTLESLVKTLDDKRRVVVGREMTKIYEEIIRGNASEKSPSLPNDISRNKKYLKTSRPNS